MFRIAILLPFLLAGCRCAMRPLPVDPKPLVRPEPLAGRLSGTVRLKGEWWPGPRMRVPPAINGMPIGAAGLETLLLGEDGSIANVYVAVKSGLGNRKFAAPARAVVLDQTGFLYSPRVLGLMTHQPLIVRNSDDVMHNPHIDRDSAAPFISKGDDLTLRFSRPEIGKKVKCDVHPWMVGWIHVSDHPFFAVTGVDGKFVLNEVPPGDYEILAWHERFERSLVSKINVEAGKMSTLDFTFVAPLKADR